MSLCHYLSICLFLSLPLSVSFCDFSVYLSVSFFCLCVFLCVCFFLCHLCLSVFLFVFVSVFFSQFLSSSKSLSVSFNSFHFLSVFQSHLVPCMGISGVQTRTGGKGREVAGHGRTTENGGKRQQVIFMLDSILGGVPF